jgi:aminotransferase
MRIPERVRQIALPQFDLLNARAAVLRRAGHPVISLGQALPGFGPPAVAVNAAREALTLRDTHTYSADAGRLSLREVLCDRLSHYAIGASPDDIVITTGANQAFLLALLTLLDAGDEVVLASPYFANHEMAVRAVGGIPIEAPIPETQGFRVTWGDLEPHLTSRTRAVVVCTPGNPTGAIIARAEMRRIVDELASRHIALVSDETYMRFVYGDAEHASAASCDGWRRNVVVVGSFSKTFGMTGWRTGYLLADRGVCEQAIKIQDAMVICAPVVSQIAVEAAIRDAWDHPCLDHADRELKRSCVREAVAQIPGLHWTPTSGGFFALVRVDGCADSTSLSLRLLNEAHVLCIPGATFGRSAEGFLRLSYGAVARDELVEALDRLASWFAACPRS